MLSWIEGEGGLESIKGQNELKASALYDALDRSEFYEGWVDPNARSRMNVTFCLRDNSLEESLSPRPKPQGFSVSKGTARWAACVPAFTTRSHLNRYKL